MPHARIIFPLCAITALIVVAVAAYAYTTGEPTCDRPQWYPEGDYPPLPLASEETLRSLDFFVEVEHDETTRVTLVMKNTTNEAMYQSLASQPAFFVITTSDCKLVWYWPRGSVFGPSEVRLEAGAERRFTREWPRIDSEGSPVSPGSYLIHTLMAFADDEVNLDEAESYTWLKMRAVRIEILP